MLIEKHALFILMNEIADFYNLINENWFFTVAHASNRVGVAKYVFYDLKNI